MLILLTRTTKTATGTQFWKSWRGSAATLWKEFPSLQPRLRNGTATSGSPWQSAHSKPRYPLLWQVPSFHRGSDDGFNETLQVTLSVLYFNLWEKCLLLKLPTENQNLEKECRVLFVQHLLNSKWENSHSSFNTTLHSSQLTPKVDDYTQRCVVKYSSHILCSARGSNKVLPLSVI